MQSKLITNKSMLRKLLSFAFFLLVSTYAFAQNQYRNAIDWGKCN